MLTNKEKYLLKNIKEGNKDAFDELYAFYWKDLYLFARKMTFSSEEAEELVQDVFVDLWVKRERLSIDVTIKGYLFNMFRFKLIDKIRKDKLHVKFTEHIVSQMNYDVAINPEQGLIARERSILLSSTVMYLPEKCRTIFILRRMNNYSISEIAEKLSISQQTVKNQLNKAFRIIRPHYERIITTFLLGFIVL